MSGLPLVVRVYIKPINAGTGKATGGDTKCAHTRAHTHAHTHTHTQLRTRGQQIPQRAVNKYRNARSTNAATRGQQMPQRAATQCRNARPSNAATRGQPQCRNARPNNTSQYGLRRFRGDPCAAAYQHADAFYFSISVTHLIVCYTIYTVCSDRI